MRPYDRLCAYLAFSANNENRYYIKLAQKDALDAVDRQNRFEREHLDITSPYSGPLKEQLQVLWGDDARKRWRLSNRQGAQNGENLLLNKGID